MDKVIKTLERAAGLLSKRRFWQPSQDKRDVRARAILNELLQSPDFPAQVGPSIHSILTFNFNSSRLAAEMAITTAILYARTEQNLQTMRKHS